MQRRIRRRQAASEPGLVNDISCIAGAGLWLGDTLVDTCREQGWLHRVRSTPRTADWLQFKFAYLLNLAPAVPEQERGKRGAKAYRRLHAPRSNASAR